MPSESPRAPDAPPLRPARFVMSAARAAAAVPNALSFTRAAMRRLVAGRYAIEKLRFDLDGEGRGEVLYRLVGEGWVFHFFLISQKLPEGVKTDRNFAQSWDAMGVLCQGEWNAEREAHLRREVPKQRAGFADYDTLIYARGNRSARLFDHVVDRLAAGMQPDARVLAPVGYILRTTAFIGNGQLGTRPLEGYEPDHPFRRPYHAQFASAFLLREYVFDLVEHLARCRSARAATLAPAFRRYLGLGNAAATGLVPFIVNHPHVMHRWVAACETALARAKQRRIEPGDEAWGRFRALLDKAIRYTREGERPDDGVFAPARTLAADLEHARREFDALASVPLAWGTLDEWARDHLGIEACETLDAIVLELSPDIVEDAADTFYAEERFELQPLMRADALHALLRTHYGWALAGPANDASQPHFWYRTNKTPRDVRRGLRGLASEYEFETTVDTVRETRRLALALESTDPAMPVGELVCARPELRHIATRVQSLAGLDYAELRADWLAADFSPFGPVRFVLSFFGLEKFEAALPKSVRGTFMQGAPIAQDVAAGADGDWPFPLMPVVADDERSTRASNTEQRLFFETPAAPCPTPPRSQLVLAPRELARMVQNALQGHGAPLGVAEFAADLAVFAQARDPHASDVIVARCADGSVRCGAGLRIDRRPGASFAAIDANDACAVLAAPAAFDQAMLRSAASATSTGATLVTRARDGSLLAALPLRAAERGALGLVAWQERPTNGERGCGIAVAGPGARGVWHLQASLRGPAALLGALLGGTDPLAGFGKEDLASVLPNALRAASQVHVDTSAFVFAVVAPDSPRTIDRVLETLTDLRHAPFVDALTITSADALEAERAGWRQRGVSLSQAQFDALAKAGEALLVPVDEEHRILGAGADPLKVF